jgi:hypothetical protein
MLLGKNLRRVGFDVVGIGNPLDSHFLARHCLPAQAIVRINAG